MEYIVEMKHISKRFPGILANNDVTIQIKKGEIFAILGENGAGKSTLMSMLFGMYEPDEGEIFIRGKKEKITSPAYAGKLNIGMVHQHFKLVSDYTITENIILGLAGQEKKWGFLPYVDLRRASKKIAELSHNYGLEVNPDDIVGQIGVSVQQRVEILKMLYREAEILIFDEPTAVLTPQEISFLLQIIRKLRAAGKTIILITHKLAEIKEVADRCAILNRGRLVDVLDVASTSMQKMANLMVGREVSLTLQKKPAEPGKNILQVENLIVYNQHKFPVVNNVSFAVRVGEIFAIAGVAGNGQVELADAIAGLRTNITGNIYLNGKNIKNLNIRQRTAQGISFIPEDRQKYGLVMDFTLAQNLILKSYYHLPFARHGVLQTAAINEYSRKLIAEYDIRSSEGGATVVRQMSGGNQQKAIIARETELHSELLIFVQPTRGLDIGAIENIHKQMLQERDKGKAILLISLELDEIMSCADTIGVIYNGQMQKIAAANTMTTAEVGRYMMGVKSDDEQ